MSIGQTAKALKIGDALPAVPAGAIINYNADEAKLTEFKNDLVILDFWSTWCVACVKAMPEFATLQQQFKGKVQFVLTTPQEKEKIEKFLTARKVDLPCFVEDKELSLYFPHNSVPHEVWISHGTIVAITYAEEVTAENIQKVLDGEKINLVEKKANFAYNIFQPLLVSDNAGNADDLLWHSVITGFLDGIPDGGGVMTDSMNRYKIRVIDGSVARLYATAAAQDNYDFIIPNRTIIESGNREKISPSSNPQYTPEVRQFFYSYELAIPATAKAEAGRFMLEDLNRYFGIIFHIKGSIEKRRVRCWVLRKQEGPLMIQTKNGPPSISGNEEAEIWQNEPFESFFSSLVYINRKQPYPFVDETGIKGKVDITLPLHLNLPSLQSYLKKYGLIFSAEDYTLPMVVIKNIH